MIPDHRLANLLDQVKLSQISSCLYHNPTASPSLFSDHYCDRSQFPLQTQRVLDQKDQVWYLEFSHDGRKLATCGNENAVTVYDTTKFPVHFILSEHTKSVPYLAWSPDDTMLITCSKDATAKLWDISVSIIPPLIAQDFRSLTYDPRRAGAYCRLISASSLLHQPHGRQTGNRSSPGRSTNRLRCMCGN